MAEKKKTTKKAVKEKEIPVAAAAEPVAEVKEAPKTAEAPSPVVNMVVEQKSEPVKILYIDSAIPNNQIPIGSGRYITGSGRIFTVSQDQFGGEFMTPLVMKLIDGRKFIILSGLTDEQRKQYNCFYEEGEVIRDEGMFDSLLEMQTEQAAYIFSNLCDEHKKLVATRFITAYFEKGDNRVTRSKVNALNKISKQIDPDGLFTPIVKDFNEKED